MVEYRVNLERVRTVRHGQIIECNISEAPETQPPVDGDLPCNATSHDLYTAKRCYIAQIYRL